MNNKHEPKHEILKARGYYWKQVAYYWYLFSPDNVDRAHFMVTVTDVAKYYQIDGVDTERLRETPSIDHAKDQVEKEYVRRRTGWFNWICYGGWPEVIGGHDD